ncbi:MAG TPA: phospholipid scramblase-related protein [Polyangiaceae bacterium]|jgi:hypothetical protein|nr:phospholipid scramblase-related protein [Polyangiaceae bacterium]
MRDIELDDTASPGFEIDARPGPAPRQTGKPRPPLPYATHPEVDYALAAIVQGSGFRVMQHLEGLEIVSGFQMANSYFVEPLRDGPTLNVREDSGGIGGAIVRNWLGGFRTVQLDVLAGTGIVALGLELRRRPSPWNRVTVRAWNGDVLGFVEQRFRLFGTRYELLDATERVLATVERSWFRFFRFDFLVDGQRVGTIEKQWAGLARELYTQADTFLVRIPEAYGDARVRLLLLGASIAIDFVHFEGKRKGGYLGLWLTRGGE